MFYELPTNKKVTVEKPFASELLLTVFARNTEKDKSRVTLNANLVDYLELRPVNKVNKSMKLNHTSATDLSFDNLVFKKCADKVEGQPQEEGISITASASGSNLKLIEYLRKLIEDKYESLKGLTLYLILGKEEFNGENYCPINKICIEEGKDFMTIWSRAFVEEESENIDTTEVEIEIAE